MSKTINESQYNALEKSEKSQYIKEWSCVCNSCKEKWHYLDSVEKKIDSQQTANALMGLGMCCNPCMTTAMANTNTQLEQQKNKFKSCPKCGSANVTKTAKYFKKQK